MNCKSCDAPLSGPYCSACGQKTITERLTAKSLLRQAVATITNIDTGFWYTTRQLFIAPATVTQNYIAGATRNYYHPLRYFLIWMGISALLGITFGLYDAQNDNINQSMGLTEDPEALARQQMLMGYVKNFTNIIPLLIVPFTSLISFWLFRKKGQNYAEHLVFNTYSFGQVALIGIPFVLLYSMIPSLIPYVIFISMLVASLYYTFTLRAFFQTSWAGSFFRALLINVGGYLLFIFSFAIVTVLVVLVIIGLRLLIPST
ncbi:MAG: DUF3667 domain-containing protein [Bacteroidota bacterium]